MAITTNKKNKIIAEWKAGRYKSAYAIAKAHGISDKTAMKIIDGTSQSNADIVDVCVKAEHAINSVRNPIEKRAIEQLVKERSIADQIESIVMDGTLANVKKIKEEIEGENKVSLYDRKTAQEAFDKALITAGKAQRFATQQINVQSNLRHEGVTPELRAKAERFGIVLY